MAATIFNYCERGRDASFWAEPANAITNAAFIVAGVFSLWQQFRKRPHERTSDVYLMVALLFAIGAGSFLFHTLADGWSAMADVIPISLFIVVYLLFALVRFVGMAPGWSLMVTAGFMYGGYALRGVKCGSDWAMRYDGGGGTCFNGSIGYLPALVALLAVGAVLRWRGHPAAYALLSAGALFAVSLTLRTLDPTLCAATEIAGMRLGTHFAWHVLNAVTLLILVLTAINHWRHGLRYEEVLAPDPGARR